MTRQIPIRTLALGVLAAMALSLATPAMAKLPARGGQYIYDPVDSRCSTDDGYARRPPCASDA
jgi:hypothetical protein